MEGPLKDKVALVVGGSQGVGRAYVLGLAAAGAKVVTAALNLRAGPGSGASLSEVAEAARSQGSSIHVSGCDVARTDNITRLVDETLINFGRIDVLLFNAVWADLSDAFAVPDDQWERSMQINIRAPYNFIRLVAPNMIARGAGSIICMSSRSALAIPSSDPAHNYLAYGATKAALHRIVTYFAEELRPHGVSVNSLSPGQVNVLAGGKPPTPEQFAPPMVYLAQQTAQTMTGRFFNTMDWNTENWGKTGPSPVI